ncbi:MarR family winged helix-turn-helix transcriptional regulator [Streptomyces sp. NPDC086766]|uniref:MarR family winged helix-turn-helix transcriptional regulator n=1 Tax=Streptomyces sp. NPDC086766 TaxID=3365754 RepID=UPI0037F4F67E
MTAAEGADAEPAEEATTGKTGGTAAATAVETIQREMTIFARRARASAGRLHPELSLVSYTLLGHLEESGGCRTTDLAAHYALDKSTVSRQVSALERAGLVERRLDTDDHRVQALRLTEAGRRILAQVTESRRAAFRERLAHWPAEDLERFAGYLTRYNAWPGRGPEDG